MRVGPMNGVRVLPGAGQFSALLAATVSHLLPLADVLFRVGWTLVARAKCGASTPVAWMNHSLGANAAVRCRLAAQFNIEGCACICNGSSWGWFC